MCEMEFEYGNCTIVYIEFVRTIIIEESSKVTGIRNLVIRSRIELWTCLFSYVKIHLLDSCSKSPGSVPKQKWSMPGIVRIREIWFSISRRKEINEGFKDQYKLFLSRFVFIMCNMQPIR
jgi:hypothetical protein